MVRRILLALAIASPANVVAQNGGHDINHGYPTSAMRDFWNVARDIQDAHEFEFAHGDAVNTVEDGRLVLSVDKGDEEGAVSRAWLVAHCSNLENNDRRFRDCRYRLVTSSLEPTREIAFDAVSASERLRTAGITAETFGSLVRSADLSNGIPKQLPEMWAEIRRVQLIVAAPLVEDFAERFKTDIIDSRACPAMLKPLRRLVNLTFEPSRVPGLSDEPRYHPSMPHGPSYTFRILSGFSTLEWDEGAAMGAPASKILKSLREMEDVCGG
jgi:hypothetical protein